MRKLLITVVVLVAAVELKNWRRVLCSTGIQSHGLDITNLCNDR